MKKIIAILSLMSISLSAAASSLGSGKAYDFMAVGLLNKVRDCSAEYLAATENNRIVLRAEETMESAEDQTVYTQILTIGRRSPAPSFGEIEMSKLLVVKRALKAKQIPAPDAPTIWEKTECLSSAISR